MGILDRLAKGAESIVEGAADVAGSRAVTGITTGLLSAKIRNSEANDALKAGVLIRVGDTLLSETIPNAIEAEKIRRTNYSTLESNYGTNFANVADASQFTLNDDTMKQLEELLKENKLDEEALKNAKFETDFNTRYQTRTQTFEEKYNPILKKLGIDNIGALGYNTVESLVGNKQPMQMKADDMAKGPVPSEAFSSMQVRDYLDPLVSTTLLNENEFAKVAQSYGFKGLIKFDTQGNASFNLPGTLDDKYNALRMATNDIKDNYLDDNKKVNVGLAVEAGSERLYRQTEGKINSITNNYKIDSTIKGVTSYSANGFDQNFIELAPDEKTQKDELKKHLVSLGSKSEQRHFANSFPTGVVFSGTTKPVKDYLIMLTR